MLVGRMIVAAGGIGLPDLHHRVRHRPAVLVGDRAGHDDALAERRLAGGHGEVGERREAAGREAGPGGLRDRVGQRMQPLLRMPLDRPEIGRRVVPAAACRGRRGGIGSDRPSGSSVETRAQAVTARIVLQLTLVNVAKSGAGAACAVAHAQDHHIIANNAISDDAGAHRDNFRACRFRTPAGHAPEIRQTVSMPAISALGQGFMLPRIEPCQAIRWTEICQSERSPVQSASTSLRRWAGRLRRAFPMTRAT